MGLFDRLRNEFIDIVEWVDDDQHTLVWRFPRYKNEIKNGAQLIVRPGQKAVFVHRGQLADVFEPGNYELKTDNLPLLGTLLGWKYGFNSPFRSEVYFISTRQLTDLKWGTPNPIMLRDPDYGPIRLRAFGTYTLKANDPAALLKELVGTDGVFEADEVTELMRSIISQSFADLIASKKIAAIDLASHYRELADDLKKVVQERIDDEYGLLIPQLFIVNVSFPEEVEKALDARTSMGVIGDLGRYQQYKVGQAVGDAANNPGGGGAGLGVGLGMVMAGRVLGAGQAVGTAEGTPGAPPPPLPDANWHVGAHGKSTGPFSLEQVGQAVMLGQIKPDTLVWKPGMANWLAASQTPALAPFLAQATAGGPPPLP